MRWGVVVPWRPGDATRAWPLELVKNLYAESFPGVPVVLGQGSTIADARNRGRLELGDVDVVLFNDADSIVEPRQLAAAVDLAADELGPVWAFDTYHRLTARTTYRLARWQEALDAPSDWTRYGSTSAGAVAIAAACFDEVGGFDSSYGDACEDLDFARRCAAVWAPRRLDGELVHLWHRRPAVEPEASSQAARYRLELEARV